MKILVLSDSHASLSFMRYCIDRVKPEHIVHLGDHFDDGKAIADRYPHIPVHQVAGNCDRFRCASWEPEVLCYEIGGVRLYMTHGHRQNVKLGLHQLMLEARKDRAAVVLYGHTHRADCHREADGLWVLNPGTCGTWGGSVGVLEVSNKEISACYLLQQADLCSSNDQ